MRATGRSSTWWLRNQALPSTQAFLALVMWSPSTVSSMSSQTQPQKVQVALLTTFSSGVALMAGVAPFRVGVGIIPDAGRGVRVRAPQPARFPPERVYLQQATPPRRRHP